MEIAYKVLSPVSGADDGDVLFSHGFPFILWGSGLDF